MLTACFTDLCHISCMFHAAILPHLFLFQAEQTPLIPHIIKHSLKGVFSKNQVGVELHNKKLLIDWL